MGLIGSRGRSNDVVIGSIFAWILGLRVLFLLLFIGSRSTANGTAGVTVLFGSVFGLSQGHAVLVAAVSADIVAALALIARPLLFATIDEAVARARGVSVTALGLAFLALAGVTAAEATQVVGALLLLGLIAAPAGAALRLTTRPYRAMWLSAALSLAAMWLGLTLSYGYPKVPRAWPLSPPLRRSTSRRPSGLRRRLGR